MNEERGITLQDCKKLFNYAKVQYEMGKYKGNIYRYLYLIFRIREAIVCYKRNPYLWIEYLNRIHSLGILGAFVMWNSYSKRKRNNWVYYFEKNERIYWKAALRSSSFQSRKYES